MAFGLSLLSLSVLCVLSLSLVLAKSHLSLSASLFRRRSSGGVAQVQRLERALVTFYVLVVIAFRTLLLRFSMAQSLNKFFLSSIFCINSFDLFPFLFLNLTYSMCTQLYNKQAACRDLPMHSRDTPSCSKGKSESGWQLGGNRN